MMQFSKYPLVYCFHFFWRIVTQPAKNISMESLSSFQENNGSIYWIYSYKSVMNKLYVMNNVGEIKL